MSGRSFVRDSAVYALSQYASRAMMLARGLAAAAALGPAGVGAWNALVLVLDYGSYASLGSLYGLDLKLPPAVARGESEGARASMRGAWGLTLAGGAVFALVVVAYLRAGTWLALTGWGWGPPFLMLAAVFAQLALHYHAATLRAHGDFGAVSAATTIQAVVGGGIGLATVWKAGVWGLLWGWLAGSLLALLRMRCSPHRPPLRPAPPIEGVPLSRAGFALFAFFMLSLILRSMDRVALVRFGGNESLGTYSLGLIAAGMVLYLPEAAAAVLFPRIAASAEGARDPERTREEVVRAQRALAALLPLPVGLGALWAAPVVLLTLPAFAGGVTGLRILVLGALLLAAGTLPGYALLGLKQGRRLLPPAAAAVLGAVILVFTVASSAPRATPVAVASALGQGLFGAVVLLVGARELVADPAARRAMIVASWAPTLWAALLVAGLCAAGGESPAAYVWRSALFVLGYSPALLRFGRGLGLRSMLRTWFSPA